MSSGRRNTRTTLLETALRLFTEGGGAVRLEDVAKAAGVSRQSVYLHFGSRAGLLEALVEHVDATHGLEALVRRIREAPDALAALDAAVALQAEYNPRIYGVARVLMAGRFADAAVKAAWDNRMEDRRRGAEQVAAWLERDGVLAPGWSVEAAADVLWAVASFQVWEQLVVDRGWSKERYAEHLRLVLRRTFAEPR